MAKKPEGSFSFPALDGNGGNVLLREAMEVFVGLGEDKSGMNRGATPVRFHPVEGDIRTVDFKGGLTQAQKEYVLNELNGRVLDALEV